jgi:hypothetical protein
MKNNKISEREIKKVLNNLNGFEISIKFKKVKNRPMEKKK